MRTLVIYKSSYGATEKYAKWIAEAVGADLVQVKDAKAEKLTGYDAVVYGGGLYAGGINGIKWLVTNFSLVKDKKVAIFTVGLADPEIEENLNHIREGIDHSLPENVRKGAEFFSFRGGMDFGRLGFMHKSMMKMMGKMLNKKNPEELTAQDRDLLDSFEKPVDFTDKKYIEPLLSYLADDGK